MTQPNIKIIVSGSQTLAADCYIAAINYKFFYYMWLFKVNSLIF